jgi:hypothetical protein
VGDASNGYFYKKNLKTVAAPLTNSSDDDFIGPSLGEITYSLRSYKKTIPNCEFIKGRFQTNLFLKKTFYKL